MKRSTQALLICCLLLQATSAQPALYLGEVYGSYSPWEQHILHIGKAKLTYIVWETPLESGQELRMERCEYHYAYNYANNRLIFKPEYDYDHTVRPVEGHIDSENRIVIQFHDKLEDRKWRQPIEFSRTGRHRKPPIKVRGTSFYRLP